MWNAPCVLQSPPTPGSASPWSTYFYKLKPRYRVAEGLARMYLGWELWSQDTWFQMLCTYYVPLGEGTSLYLSFPSMRQDDKLEDTTSGLDIRAHEMWELKVLILRIVAGTNLTSVIDKKSQVTGPQHPKHLLEFRNNLNTRLRVLQITHFRNLF